MCRVSGVLELLKQSGSGQLQRVEALLQHSLFPFGLSVRELLLACFACFDLIGNRLAFPATSHNFIHSLVEWNKFIPKRYRAARLRGGLTLKVAKFRVFYCRLTTHNESSGIEASRAGCFHTVCSKGA